MAIGSGSRIGDRNVEIEYDHNALYAFMNTTLTDNINKLRERERPTSRSLVSLPPTSMVRNREKEPIWQLEAQSPSFQGQLYTF